jgi:hypothetical protein
VAVAETEKKASNAVGALLAPAQVKGRTISSEYSVCANDNDAGLVSHGGSGRAPVGPGNPAAPQMRERLLFGYPDTFEPFGLVLGLETFLRAVRFKRVI